MRLPSGGPFLEFNFYWADVAEGDAFARLVAALLDLGAVFRRCDIASMDELEQALTDPGADLIQVNMEGATSTTRGVAEIVTYLDLPEGVARSDHRPIAIWTEGQWTEAWLHETKAGLHETKAGLQRARTLGRRAKDRFCALIERTRPSYAAITVEYELPTPSALRRKPDGHAFHDFYVSASYLGREALAGLADLFAGAYIEPVADGVYISCWGLLNPRGRGLTIGMELERKTMAVARAIAAARQPRGIV